MNKFNEEKKQLKTYYKRLKVGLVLWEDIPEKYQDLLLKYYPVECEV